MLDSSPNAEASNHKDNAHRSWVDIAEGRVINIQGNAVEQPQSWGLGMNNARSGMELEYVALSDNCSGIIDIDDNLIDYDVFNAGNDHDLDLNLGISTTPSGDGPRDNETSGQKHFHPYTVRDPRRSNVIL
ncbi:hypothetical protein U1Q18_031186 [Sarracenia purpurea var. burkii]